MSANAPLATPGGYDYSQFIPSTDHSAGSSSKLDRVAEHAETDDLERRIASTDLPTVAGAEERAMFPLKGDTSLMLNKPLPTRGVSFAPSLPPKDDMIAGPAPSPTKPPTSSSAPDISTSDDIDKQVYGQQPMTARNRESEAAQVKRNAQDYLSATDHDPKADLVVVFNLPKPDADQSDWQAAEVQYRDLKSRLNNNGLNSIGVAGAKGKNVRLILVKAASQQLLHAQAQQEKLADWIGSLRETAVRHDPHVPRDFSQDPLIASERLRLVNQMVAPAVRLCPQVAYYFPPHDHNFNTRWLRSWTSSKTVFQIPEEQLVRIRDHFGSSIALYFEFLRYYFLSLIFPSFIGFLTWLGGHYFSRLYSILIALWSIVALEGWKLRERQLAVRWNTYGISKRGTVRPDFKAEDLVISPITGQKIPYSPWWRREAKIAATIPVLFGFAAVLAAVISMIFAVEVIINEVYGGPFKSALSVVPIILFAGLVPQVVGLWGNIAAKLTDWENHPTETGHDRSLTLKNFALNGIVSYGALSLTSYVYLPFGSFVIPVIVNKLRRNLSRETLSSKSLAGNINFAASPERLTNTLFALMTTTQAVGAFMEIVLPYLQRKWVEYQTASSESTSSSTSIDEAKTPQQKEGSAPSVQKSSKASYAKAAELLTRADKKTWLQRIQEEVELPEFKLFNDYAEMAIQFGHIVLWSTAWPLAPVAAFINNFFEIRGDAFKLCVNSRRPLPHRSDTIGPWIEVLSFVTYLGALTNASLIYLLKPRNAVIVNPSIVDRINTAAQGSLTAAAFNRTLLIEQKRPLISLTEHDLPSVWSALLAALLCALAGEHAFVLMRYGIAHLMEMTLWRGTVEELTLRASEYRLKHDYVESRGAQAFEREISRLKEQHSKIETKDGNQQNSIWHTADDAGIREAMDKKHR